MPSITKEQALKLDKQAPKGWNFDLRYYVFHGEKTLRRIINLDDTHCVEAKISYHENVETRKNEFCSWRVAAGHYHICLHVSTWTVDANGTGHSYGLGHFENLDNGKHTRRNYTDLCKIAATITDEMILSYTGSCNGSVITAC